MACGVVPAAMKSMISRYDGIAALLIADTHVGIALRASKIKTARLRGRKVGTARLPIASACALSRSAPIGRAWIRSPYLPIGCWPKGPPFDQYGGPLDRR